jgi:hypothetical protein
MTSHFSPTTRVEALWWLTGSVLLVLLVLTVLVAIVDTRTIAEERVWEKPMKFQISLALHFATLALIVRGLSDEWRASSFLLAVAIVAVASTAFEIGYIMLQAGRQQASHFNLSTPFYAAMYVLMAMGAVFITGAAGAVGLIAALDGASRLSAVVRLAVALGLMGGAVLTMIVAFTMRGRLDRYIGATAAGARVPLTGWSLVGGDLRVPHFLATHLMQAVPLAGLVIERFAPGQLAMPLVCSFAA